MSFAVKAPPIQATIESVSKTAAASPEAKAQEDAKKVGREFEAILVRQMLSTTKIAGKGGGYGDMAIESLANAVTSAGGLGMGRAIEDAINQTRAAHAPKASDPKAEPAPPKK